MAKCVLVIGESGRGKSASMRDMEPTETMLIRAIKKDLPFPRANEWKDYDKENKKGNVWTTDNADKICNLMQKCREVTGMKRIVVDDFQYVLANEFMRRSSEKGFDKFSDIGYNAWAILNVASQLPDDMRVYIMWHPDVEDDGRVKVKTVGKITERYTTPEGYFTICLRAVYQDEKYYFRTQTDGNDPAKSPMGMFERMMDNSLEVVDKRIVEYYKIGKKGEGKGEKEKSVGIEEKGKEEREGEGNE